MHFRFAFENGRPYVQPVTWVEKVPAGVCSHCGAEQDADGEWIDCGERMFTELPPDDGSVWCLTTDEDNKPSWRHFLPMHGGAWLSRDRTRFQRMPL